MRIFHAVAIFSVLAGIGLLSACQASKIGTGPAADAAPTLTLSTLVVDKDLKAGVSHQVSMPYEVSGEGSIVVQQACFWWSGEGPYCFSAQDDTANKTVSVTLRTNNPNTYRLAGYVKYESNGWDKSTNTVSQIINVK